MLIFINYFLESSLDDYFFLISGYTMECLSSNSHSCSRFIFQHITHTTGYIYMFCVTDQSCSLARSCDDQRLHGDCMHRQTMPRSRDQLNLMDACWNSATTILKTQTLLDSKSPVHMMIFRKSKGSQDNFFTCNKSSEVCIAVGIGRTEDLV